MEGVECQLRMWCKVLVEVGFGVKSRVHYQICWVARLRRTTGATLWGGHRKPSATLNESRVGTVKEPVHSHLPMNLRILFPAILTLGVALAKEPEGTKPSGNSQTSPAPGATSPSAQVGNPLEAGADLTLLTAKYTNSLVLSPGRDNKTVAELVSKLLQAYHFSQHSLDDEISQKFFDRYLESLDPQRMYFLETDLEGFAQYRKTLDDATRVGNTQPAYEIFNRFLERVDQQYMLATELLKTEQFRFDSEEKYLVNRKDAARPANLEEARKLWRSRLRFEYLSEKLNQPSAEKTYRVIWDKAVAARFDEIAPALTNSLGKDKAEEWASFAKLSYEHKPNPDRLVVKSTRDEIPVGTSTNLPTAFTKVLDAKLEKSRHEDILKTLTRRYNRTLRALKQYDGDDVLQLYLDSLAHSYDPHSDYFGKSELENFAINMNLSLFGIGATLSTEDGYTVIREIKPGSPAEKSRQLKVGDKIVAVAQGEKEPVDVIDEKLNKVVEQIRGPKNTEVRLTVIPSDAPDPSARKMVKIVRDEIKLEESEAKAKLVELPDSNGKVHRVGVIDLPSFYANFPIDGRKQTSVKKTSTDVEKLVKKLKEEKMDGLILDLRRNGGGSLEEAVRLTGLFIKQGPVVQVKDAKGRPMVDEDEDPSVLYDGPMLVLTSRFSASASEIVAGALQDYGRALVVGDSMTHGKGTVQTLQQLSQWTKPRNANLEHDPGATKITIRKFYRASGASTQFKGVIPDIVLPSVNNHADIGESAMPNALPYDTIPSAEYEKLAVLTPHMTELNRRSMERVTREKDFEYVREDIERYKKLKDEKFVSLNEVARRKEKEENKNRAELRKKELLARDEKLPTTYEITLKLADQPGLPPPMTNKTVVAISRVDERALHPPKSTQGDSAGNKPAPVTAVVQNPGADSSKEAAAAAEAKAKAATDEDSEDAAEETGVAADVHLKEAERILIDLILLSSGKSGMAAKLQ